MSKSVHQFKIKINNQLAHLFFFHLIYFPTPTLPTMKIQTEVTDELKLIFLSAPLSIYLLMASDFKSRLQLLGSEITGFTQDKLYSGFSCVK